MMARPVLSVGRMGFQTFVHFTLAGLIKNVCLKTTALTVRIDLTAHVLNLTTDLFRFDPAVL